MTIEENRRKKITRKKIEDAFLSELETKSMEQVKITDICKRADVNRGSFYSNYMDIYDLADQIFFEMQSEVETLYHGKVMEDMLGEHSFFLSLFQHVRDNQALYKTCFKLGYDKRLIIQPENYYRDYGAKLYDPEYVEYHMAFFKAGLNALIRMWLDGGCRETPEEMVEIINAEYRGKIY